MDSKKNPLKGIGKKLREEARDIVEAKLPEGLAELLRQLEAIRPQPPVASRNVRSA
jgi:predicted house-cleaning noncanonical NTP pyrophosphatase (MazG superfamily)